MRITFVNNLIEEAKKNPNIELLTGDLGFGVLKEYSFLFSSRFTNCGIAEQNMITMAGGMAIIGKVPVVYSIGNFPTLRALEQIRNDVCYYNANVKIVSVGGGYTYGNLGMSHHATEDIGVLRPLPNLSILAPADKNETNLVTEYMFSKQGPCYLRLERDNNENFHSKEFNYKVGGLYFVRKNNSKTLIISYGSIVREAIDAELNVDIATMPILKPIDPSIYTDIAKYENIITLEEHNIIGGLGDIIANIIAGHRLDTILYKFGINDKFCHDVGDQCFLRKVNKIDSKSIKEFVVKNNL